MPRPRKTLWAVAGAFVLAACVGLGVGFAGFHAGGPLPRATPFVVPAGANLTTLAGKLRDAGVIASPDAFRIRARFLGSSTEIKAGEYELPAHASEAQVLAILTGGDTLNRFIVVPEGMPSAMVYDRLMARPQLTGSIEVPAEGSILPDSYAFERGESRAAVVSRMQASMTRTLADLWAKRGPNTVATTPQEAVILASIVEKETSKPSERAMVAGLYSNRLRQRMMLQADPTIIYPITRGKPLGRRIRQSEIQAVNDYNTYSMVGLPKGPITNPGKDSIAAVLHPAATKSLYMVADGTGGHAFADTLAEHNANVAKWFALRRARGEI